MMLVFNTSCSILMQGEDVLDKKCDSMGLFEEASIALGFYQRALNDYAEDQSADNCKELKASGMEYIDAIEAYRKCEPDGNTDNDSELDQAKVALADLDC